MPIFDNLRIHMVHGDTSKTAAFVSCKILTEAGALFLNSMALVRGANGLYLSFPSRKREGQPVKGFEDYYYMERSLKELIQATAIEEFRKKCDEVGLDPEKACAPLPPGTRGSEPEPDYEPQPRDNASRGFAPSGPGRGGYRDDSGPGRGGGYRDDFASRGGGGRGGGYRDDFANRGGGGGRGSYGGGGGGRGGYGGGGFDRGGGGRGGGYRGDDYGNRGGRGGGGGYRGDDFGNRVGYGGQGGFGHFQGPMSAPGQGGRPLSNRFNPFTGHEPLGPEKTEKKEPEAGEDGE